MIHEQQVPLTYNLFASKADVGVCCAIRVDRPVPDFLNGMEWEHRGLLADAASSLRDFNARAAQQAAGLTGYYLFTALRP
ncbi:MAG: hypothetical protein K2Y56_25815 [Methylobacterium sp.]|uniref:hypothetical protein n=1 Tax=Methylobacterium sp. TaxID=409 RepID=UPI0025DF16AF|nr:hypothetical protein [Methylobacterium sp.]MBX9934883.1 hypothetical protein [Methylobacterium sp.]